MPTAGGLPQRVLRMAGPQTFFAPAAGSGTETPAAEPAPALSRPWAGQPVSPDPPAALRIIQSIPSPKAEPFKLWLAEVGRERIEETIDPELTIDRALDTYLKKGYSREWINQRLQAIQVRKELTDEWQDRGVQKGVEFAILCPSRFRGQ